MKLFLKYLTIGICLFSFYSFAEDEKDEKKIKDITSITLVDDTKAKRQHAVKFTYEKSDAGVITFHMDIAVAGEKRTKITRTSSTDSSVLLSQLRTFKILNPQIKIPIVFNDTANGLMGDIEEGKNPPAEHFNMSYSRHVAKIRELTRIHGQKILKLISHYGGRLDSAETGAEIAGLNNILEIFHGDLGKYQIEHIDLIALEKKLHEEEFEGSGDEGDESVGNE